MAALDADIWVCGECRSVNALRAKQCYRCRTPRDVAAVDPSQIEGTGHGKLREVALPEFHSSRGAALLASALLIVLAVMQIVWTVADTILLGRVARNPGLLADPTFARSTESLVAGTLLIAALGVALLALIAWAFWLSRAVMAMPALGLGYPAANGLMAFVENFLPGLNLFRVPAIVRDVMRRLEPETLRGEALIFAAWIGLLGGYLVPRFGVYLGLFSSGTLEEAVRVTLIVQAVSTALVVVGATFLVALIWWIERRIERRRAAQLAGEPAPAVGVAAAVPWVGTQGTAVLGDARLTASDPPIDEDRVVEPVRSIASRADTATFASRSITAATGAASTPLEVPAAAETTLASSPSAEEDRPIGSVVDEPLELGSTDDAVPAVPLPTYHAAPPVLRPAPDPPPAVLSPAGPQLHLRIEDNGSMIATLEGESEGITIAELRAAATALAGATGSAVIETATTIEALSLAEQASETFANAGVPTTMKD